MKEGYSLWAIGTHPTKREVLELVIRPASLIPEMFNLPGVMAVSLHQYVEKRELIDFFGAIAAVTAAPVVNTDAMERKEEIEAKLKRDIKLSKGVIHLG